MTKITISEKRRETVKKEFFGFYAIKYAESSKKGLVYTRLRAIPLFSFVLLFPGLRLNARENDKKGRRREEK